ncbi:hypothetical protein [Nonomuraea zeae]|uniref:hypothetical protein n=1 Tax=Nonomuraea zeae TaxID=1642303 RepID=UPI0019801697|nr:hypothetical protein [Nonomuraea zeae]
MVPVKTHLRQEAGGRSTDRADLPEHRAAYAMGDIDTLVRAARWAGVNVGIYAERHFDDSLPWTRMRQVYRLLGLGAATAPAASRRPAARRWSWTCCRCRRSRRCSQLAPSTSRSRRHARRGPLRP